MKRSNQFKDIQYKKFTKYDNQSDRSTNLKYTARNLNNLDLPDELVNEICSWIPSKTLIKVSILINKQWERVVRNLSSLTLALNDGESISFCSAHRQLATRITCLSLLNDWNVLKLGNKAFESMVNLTSLKIKNFELDKSSINNLARHNKLKCLEMEGCHTSWSDLCGLIPLMSLENVSLSMTPFRPDKYPEGNSESECKRLLSNLPSITTLKFEPHGLCYYDEASLEELLPELSSEIEEAIFKLPKLSTLAIRLVDGYTEYFPHMKCLTCLEADYSTSDMKSLSNIKSLTHLEKLSILFTANPQKGWTECLPDNLTSLTVSDIRYGADIERISRLGNLSALELSELWIEEEEEDLIISSSNLSSLDMSSSVVSEQALKNIREMTNLTNLSISQTEKQVRGPNKDKFLAVSDLFYTNEDGKVLTKLTKLNSIDVSESKNEADMENLFQFKELKSLTLVNEERKRDRPILSHIYHIKKTPSLTSLVFHYSSIGDNEAELISTMDNITSLEFVGCGIRHSQLAHIAAMKNLKRLVIKLDNISFECAAILLRMNNLEYLDLSHSLRDLSNIAPEIASKMVNLKTFSFNGKNLKIPSEYHT